MDPEESIHIRRDHDPLAVASSNRHAQPPGVLSFFIHPEPPQLPRRFVASHGRLRLRRRLSGLRPPPLRGAGRRARRQRGRKHVAGRPRADRTTGACGFKKGLVVMG